MILVAFPFKCEKEEEKKQRITFVKNFIGEKLKLGQYCFSPILYAVDYLNLDLSEFYDKWTLFCKDRVCESTKLIVIQFEGWEQSQGIKNEINAAILNEISIEYIKP